MFRKRDVLFLSIILLFVVVGSSFISALSINLVPKTGHCFTPLTAGPYSGHYVCTNNITTYDGIKAIIKIDSSNSGWVNSTWVTNISNTSIISSAIINTSVEVSTTASVFLQIQVYNISSANWINVSGCNYSFSSGNTIENKLCNISSFVTRGSDIPSLVVRSFAYRTSGGGVEERFDHQIINLEYIPESPPVVFLDSPLNNTFSPTRTVAFNASFTDDNSLHNSTLYVWNASNALINKTTVLLSGTQNQTLILVSLPYDGRFFWNYLAGDSGGNDAFHSTNFTLLVDTAIPYVQIVSPQNTNYSSVQTDLNYTVSDANLQSCWYSTNNGLTNNTVSCGVNLTVLDSGQGSSTWRVWANDSAGNVNQSNVTFMVDSNPPFIQFISPTYSSGIEISTNTFIINVSASDFTFQNVTIRLYNSSRKLIQENSSLSGNFSVIYSNLIDGIYFYNATATDSFNFQNSTETRNISIDSTPPGISFVSPVSTNYSTKAILINISAIGALNVWFFNGTANQTYSYPELYNFSEGYQTLIAYANDSAGNVNSTSITFSVDTILPKVTILSPVNGSTLGINQSISLDFSIQDSNLQTCWYSIDSGLNTTLPLCNNSTFNVSEGNHILRLYANDSAGNIGLSSSSFFVQVGAPSILPISPINVYLNYGSEISIVYIPADIDLLSCSLWGNFNGTFSKNQTNLNPVSSVQNSFSVNLNDGNYLWAVSCNDTVGNNAVSGNQSFYVDTTLPNVSLIAPKGTYASLSNIPITLNVVDASPIKCFYNITFSATGNVVIGNSELLNCASTTFTLDTQSSYFFNLAINDSAGNVNITRNSFIVSIPSAGGGSSSGSGGSGGGSSFSGISSFNLELSNLEKLKINRGESDAIQLKVINIGSKFLNSCYFSARGGISDWISGQDIYSLGPGQSVDYVFNVNVPINVEVGNYFTNLEINCQEINATLTYNVEIIGGEFEVNILNSERVGTKLRISYSIQNFATETKNLQVIYKLINSKNKIIVEGSFDPVQILSGEKIELNGDFELPKNSLGDYSLVMEVSDGLDLVKKQQLIKLTTGGISGFAISDDNFRAVSWLGIVILLSFAIFIVVKIIINQLAIRHTNNETNRQFITIDLNN